jgi:hypothetical protein
MINPVNPYHPNYHDPSGLASAPFAGRKDSFARLYTRLLDPLNTGAILFLGRQHVGKTALVHNAITIFQETAVGVYVPLRETNLDTEAHWLLALAQAMTTALVDQGFTLSRLSQLDPVGDQPREWLEVTFLPQVLGAVRRKLLILLDDADCMLMAVRAGRLPSDTFAYIFSLAQKFQNLYVALTLDSAYESDIDDLAPLVASTDVIRLTNLSADETQWLLQEPVRGLYAVPDDCALAAHRLIGGAPGLAQHMGYEFFRRWENSPELNVLTLDDMKALTPAIYLYNETDYRALWERLSANERIVLTATSDLVYNDPLGRLDATAIQGWLTETDFPLDLTAINATLRSLEYRDILVPTPGGITLSASLMQSWLLDNARLGRRMPPSASAAAPVEPTRGFAVTPRLLRTLFMILVILVIANIIAYAWVNSGSPGIAPNIEPTVTLATAP